MQELGFLRPIEEAELEMVRSWRNAPAVRFNMYTTHEISAQEHQSWWGGVKADSHRKYFMYMSGGQPLGIVALTAIHPSSENCAWAFYASPDAHPGTGGRMEFLALDHVFITLGLHKLYCEVLAFNTPVLRLHKKFGFVEEGVFRQQHKGPDGFVDVHRLGLLRDEWLARREVMRDRLMMAARSA